MPNEITKKEIGVGVIGMGWMGGCHSRSYRNLGDRFHESGISAKLIICSDSIDERAKECQSRYSFLESTSNWREVIEHPEVQAVSITAPNGMHLEMIEAAAAAGKHVYCEKPAGKDPQETALAERAARKAGIISKLGYNYRYPPVLQYAMALVNTGKLGRLTHYRGRFFSCYASDPYGLFSWRFEKENGHGTLTDLMSHTIDMAHMVVGPIKRLCSNIKIIIDKRPIPSDDGASHYAKGSADSEMATVTNDDYVGAIVEFENGVVGTIESCRVTNGPKTDMGFELKWHKRVN
jgi:predicted dehydrogenase